MSILFKSNNNNNDNNNNTNNHTRPQPDQRTSLRSSIVKMVALRRDDVQYSHARLLNSNGNGNNTDEYWIRCLRWATAAALLVVTVSCSVGVYTYTAHQQHQAVAQHAAAATDQIVERFHSTIERTLSATAELSSTITSYAAATNQTFPTVTLPDFELRASYSRVQSGSHIVHYFPLVTDDTRQRWEDYAQRERQQIEVAFQNDQRHRERQDDVLWKRRHQQQQQANNNNNNNHQQTLPPSQRRRRRQLESAANATTDTISLTVLDDGTNYHPHIWSNGAVLPRGDVPPGMGMYLPSWQRSPVNAVQQGLLNMDWRHTKVFAPDMLDTLLRERQALWQKAVLPKPDSLVNLHKNLRLSQYRDHAADYVDGLSSFLAYPVFASVHSSDDDNDNDNNNNDNNDNPIVGVLATNIYWKVLLSKLLPPTAVGIVCVIQNGYNQTFAYRIDGPNAVFLGMDPSQFPAPSAASAVVSTTVNDYLNQHASAETTAYRTVPLSPTADYRLSIYPTATTATAVVTQTRPVGYMLVILAGFGLAAALFVVFAHLVERRQAHMLDKVVEQAEKAAAAERELNEFLSHEVRNPLAAAMAATTFVSTALLSDQAAWDPETQQNAREDIQVVQSSLAFINDFLRSMLDIHRATLHQLQIHNSLVDLKLDVVEPVLAIVYQRTASFTLECECADDLLVTTDPIRLKQVILNLVRNATKFVERGFVRVRAGVEDSCLYLYVEDSGPGIPAEKRANLFHKYQQSLDLLNQGTGLGLSLSKSLVNHMGGQIWLDETYDSGVPGCPGACFVIQFEHHHRSPPQQQQLDGDGGGITPGLDNDDSLERALEVAEVERNRPRMSLVESRECGFDLLEAPPTNGPMDSLNESFTAAHLMVDLRQLESNNHNNSGSINNNMASMNLNDVVVAELGCSRVTLHCSAASSVFKPDCMEHNNHQSSAFFLDDHQEHHHPMEGIRVLFVDDDAMLRKLFVRAVRKARPEWNIKEASSGEMALKMCETDSFDLIFLDQYMASTEKQLLGTETAQAMRARGNTAIVCGLSANDVRSGFLKAGADDFLMKPFPCRGEALEAVLRQLLARWKPPS